MKTIPVVDLSAQYRSIEAEINSAVFRVLGRGDFILGEEVAFFEKEFSSYCNTAFGVGVASGTDALFLALRACEIGPGHEVITSAYTAVATIVAIELTGARPILVDIDHETLTIDPLKIKLNITPNTRAIVPVHLFGNPADMAPILQIAEQFHLYVIEDCAQAHGATYNHRKVGGLGHLSAFSFYPTKNLGAYGDAGIVLTNYQDLYEKLLRLRQYGWKDRYISDQKGINSRLDNLQAAVLRTKLRYLDQWNNRRTQIAKIYDQQLSLHNLILPPKSTHSTHVYHQYVIRSKDRDDLRSYLFNRSIHSLIHYPMPIHLQPAYKNLGYVKGKFPNSELAANEVISLPVFPELTGAEINHVCGTIRDFYLAK